MTQYQPDYQGNPLRFLESRRRTQAPFGSIQGQPRWRQGDVIEIGRLFIPPDVSARLVKYEAELRERTGAPEILKPTFFGEILDTDLQFFFLTFPGQSWLPEFWKTNVGTASSTIAGFPGLPMPGIAPFNLYTFSVGDKRELQNAVPIPANTTVFLIARFYQDFVVTADPASNRFQKYEDSLLNGRLVVEVGGSENQFTKQRMMQ